jgi:hypothetical protein
MRSTVLSIMLGLLFAASVTAQSLGRSGGLTLTGSGASPEAGAALALATDADTRIDALDFRVAELARNLVLTYYRAYVYAPGITAWTDGYISTFGGPTDDHADASGVFYDSVEKGWSNLDRPLGFRLGNQGNGKAQYLYTHRWNGQDVEYGFAWSMWVKPYEYSPGWVADLGGCNSRTAGGAMTGFMLQILGSQGGETDAGKIRAIWGDSSYFTTTDIIPVNEWTHVVLQYDGADIQLWTNGILACTETGPSIVGEGSAADGKAGKQMFTIGIGNDYYSHPSLSQNHIYTYNGEVAGLVLSSGAFTEAQIQVLMDLGGNIKDSDMEGYDYPRIWTVNFKGGVLDSTGWVYGTEAYGTAFFSPVLQDYKSCFTVGPGRIATNEAAYMASSTYELLTTPANVRCSVLMKADITNDCLSQISTDSGSHYVHAALSRVSTDIITGYGMYEWSAAAGPNASTFLIQKFTFPTNGGFLRGWSRQVD